jgi:hypothetical protein
MRENSLQNRSAKKIQTTRPPHPVAGLKNSKIIDFKMLPQHPSPRGEGKGRGDHLGAADVSECQSLLAVIAVY